MVAALTRWLRFGGILFVVLLVAWHLWLFAAVCWWQTVNPSASELMVRQARANQRPVPALRWRDDKEISRAVKLAVVTAEDARFLSHQGFDWRSLQQAYNKNQRLGHFAVGGSTITQQLAKNLFLWPDKSWLRKGEEALVTLMLEAVWSKQRILNVYLNVVEWGDGIYGIDAATHRHFAKKPSQINQSEAARLAAMLPNPRYFEKHRQHPRLRKKIATIYGNMNATQIP